MKPVKAYTFAGKFIVVVIRSVLFIVWCLKGNKWKGPRKNFHEDPMHYSFTDIIYFAYKYYYNPPESFENNASHQKLNTAFLPPENKKILAEISISAGGDLMPYEWINKDFCKHLWDDIGSQFFGSDIVMANLETPLHASKPVGSVPELMLNDMEFNASPEMFDVFNGNNQYKGFDVLSIANNHSFDKGEEGIIQTIRFLENKKIWHCGNASTPENIHNFPIIDRNGIKIAFIACTYSLNHLKLPRGKEYLCNHIELNRNDCDLTFIKKQVSLAHQRGADLVVGSMHYGNAYQLFPSDHIINITHRLFDECGMDIIIGNHGHNIQPVEYYNFVCPVTHKQKQGLAAYCLGDFVAYDIFTWGHLPLWLKIDIIKTSEGTCIRKVEINPVYTLGIYHNSKKRELRFLNASNLWKQLEKNTSLDMPEYNHMEVQYLKSVYERVFWLDA